MDYSHIALPDEAMAADESYLSSIYDKSKRQLGATFDTMAKDPKSKPADVNVQACKEHMRVFLRVRPFTEEEKNKMENQGCMEIEDEHTLLARAPIGSNTFKNSQHGCGKQTHQFTFSEIFKENTTQKQFFDKTVLDTVKDFIEGQNCLIFTYGVTNSGKTYTIQGHAKDGGILPRALDVIFNSIKNQQWETMSLKPSMFCEVTKLSEAQQETEQKNKQKVLDVALDEESDVTVSSMVADSDCSRLTIGSQMSEDSLNTDSGHGSDPTDGSDKETINKLFKEAAERVREDAAVNVTSQGQIRFSVWVTFVEIYNEYIYDLLEPLPKKKNVRRPTLTLREDKHGIPYVKGVKEIQVTSADEAYKILMIGKQNLQMACTKLNHNSSRSHCIFTIKALRVVDKENPHVARVSMLSFCDLAGAERYGKTQSAGERIKEAGNINTSLLSLGRCIKVLRHNQMNRDHQQMVPFRDSKLTRLFQSFLTGQGKASMIVNINQCASTFDETLHALKYSAIAKQVVIVQEPQRELEMPPPDKRSLVPKTNRLMSLVMPSSHGAPRESIPFATPRTLARILQEEEDEAETPKAVPREEYCSQEQVLKEVIETLKNELLREKSEKDVLEWKIRNEVCQEMQQQLVTIEQQYEDRMREMKERLEDRTDSKVNLLLMSMKKRKRPRKEPEEEEVIDESELLKATIEVKNEQIENLEAKVAELEKQLGKTSKSETPTNSGSSKEKDEAENELMEQLKAKEVEVSELGEMLMEANDAFQEKIAEIVRLEQDAEDQKTRSKEQDLYINELERKLEQANAANKQVTEQLTLMKEKVTELEEAALKDCPSCQQQVVRLGEVVSKLADTEAEVDKINTDFVRLQREVSEKALEIEEAEERLAIKERELAELRGEMQKGEKKNSKVTKLLEQLAHLEQEIGAQRETNKTLQAQLGQQQDVNIDLNTKVSKLQDNIVEHQKALTDHETFVAELNDHLKAAKEALDTATAERDVFAKKVPEMGDKLKKQEEELFQTIERLAVLEEERDKLANDTATKEKKIIEDGRRSLKLESKIAALEESLQQANSALRETSLEAAELKETVQELENLSQALENEHAECKPRLADLQAQLEDYVLKVNEQAEQIGELEDQIKEQKSKESELLVKTESAESKLQDQDGEQNKLRIKVQDLEARLAAERKQQKNAGSELDELLQSKAITIEELNTSVSQLTSKITLTQNKLKLSEEKAEKLEVMLEEAQDKLRAHKVELTSAKVTDSEMKDNVDEMKEQMAQTNMRLIQLKKELEESRAKQQETKEQLEAAENKISSLQVSLEMAEENGEELMEVRATLEETRTQLEQAKSHLTQKSLQDKNALEVSSCTDVEKLQEKIRKLESEVSEAQYGAQVNSRTLRREKSQVEKRLKETEQELEEARKTVLSLQSRLAMEKLTQPQVTVDDDDESDCESSNSDIEHLKQELEEQKSKVTRLEDVIKDLETCLLSAKSSQQTAVDTAERYRQKYRDLEDQLNVKEDRLQSLEGRLSELDDKALHIQTKQIEIDRLNESVCDLEHKCKEYRAEMETLEARLSYIGMLEEKNDSILSELEENSAKVQELSEMLHHAEERIKELESEVEQTATKLSEAQEARKNLEEALSTSESTTCEVSRMRSELENLSKSVRDQSSTIKELEADKLELETKIKTSAENLETCTADIQAKLDAALKEKLLAVNELERFKDTTLKLEEESTQKSSTIDNLKETTEKEREKNKEEQQKLGDELSKLQNTLSEIQTKASLYEENSNKLQATIDCLKEEKAQLQETKDLRFTEVEAKMTKLEKEREKIMAIDQAVHEKNSKLTADLEAAKLEANTAVTDLELVQKDLDSLRAEKAEVSSLLMTHETSIASFKEEVASLKDEVHSLSKKAEKLALDKEESKVTIQSLRLEVDVKDKKITELEEQLKTTTQSIGETEDLEKALKREKALRQQLSEASARQEEQNGRFTALEERLKTAREDADCQEETARIHRDAASKLKEELRSVRQALASAQEEHESLVSSTTQERNTLEAKVLRMEEELEKKETKLRARSTTITELMSKIDKERNSYEISLQDARANEAVLAQLKKALEDQDATIELQEKALSQKEEEISVIQKDYETLIEKYEQMAKDTSSSSVSVRDLTTQLKRLREEKREAEKEAAKAEKKATEACAAAGRTDVEKAQFKRDLEDTNRELREMEKMLSEARKEIDQLKQRLDEMRGNQKKAGTGEQTSSSNADQKLALLKTKFMALETTKQNLETEVEELRLQVNTAEEKKKVELDQWREDRDKLVSQLEKILKQKEAQITEMRRAAEAAGPRTEHELHNKIDKLELELSDKEAIIEQLSRHLEGSDSRRTTRHRLEEDSIPAMRKEIENMQKKVELERLNHKKELTLVVKAKDEIISDLRNSNLQLQSRLPAASQPNPTVVGIKQETENDKPQDHELESVAESPAIKPPPRRSTRRGRQSRKRKSVENELDGEKPARTSKRKSTRQQKQQAIQLQVSFDENNQNADLPMSEDGVDLDEQQVSKTPLKRAALTDALNTPCQDGHVTFVSPVSNTKAPMSERSKRRVKLRTTMAEPFSESPPLTPVPTPVKDNTHEVVTRQLRTRRKCTNV